MLAVKVHKRVFKTIKQHITCNYKLKFAWLPNLYFIYTLTLYFNAVNRMDSIPQISDDSKVDLVINVSDPNPKWTIITKETKERKTDTFSSIGKFRSDLSKLKVLRGKGTRNQLKIKPEQITIEPSVDTFVDDDVQVSVINVTQEISGPKRLLSTTQISPNSRIISAIPPNPLIDQTVRIYKPTEWIDCISRESKRVFVKDNWIVARILLPPVSKDSIGLKRLTLE